MSMDVIRFQAGISAKLLWASRSLSFLTSFILFLLQIGVAYGSFNNYNYNLVYAKFVDVMGHKDWISTVINENENETTTGPWKNRCNSKVPFIDFYNGIYKRRFCFWPLELFMISLILAWTIWAKVILRRVSLIEIILFWAGGLIILWQSWWCVNITQRVIGLGNWINVLKFLEITELL